MVLARDVIANIDGPLDVRHLLLRLADGYPSCWTFCVDDLVGATPELLVRRTGDLDTTNVSYFDIDAVTDITFIGARKALSRQAKASEFRDFAMLLASNPITDRAAA